MRNNWFIQNICPEMKCGFYIDIGSSSDIDSPTTILDAHYRWRGIYSSTVNNRIGLCKHLKTDSLSIPDNLFFTLQSIHPGSMIHYTYINGVKNVYDIFDKIFLHDIICPYSNSNRHLRYNFISVEISKEIISDVLMEFLMKSFQLEFIEVINDNFRFLNQFYTILI